MLSSVVQLSARCFRGLNVAKVTSTSSYIQVHRYSRFSSRKPVTIINEDELFEVEEAAYPVEKDAHFKDRNRNFHLDLEDTLTNTEVGKETGYKPYKKKQKKNAKPKVDSSKKNMFTKLYENEKLLSPLMLEIKSRRRKQKDDKILLEGTRLMTDAIQAGLIPEKIIFSNAEELKKLPIDEKNTQMYKVPYRTIQLWSNLTTPSGTMGIFKTPDVESFHSPDSLPITIVCDNIRDPGNMGSILRAAAGVGCDRVILTKGCVDLWESKVLRSAAGAHFRLPIFSHKDWYEIRYMLNAKSQVIVADNRVQEDEPIKEENDSEEVQEVPETETGKEDVKFESGSEIEQKRHGRTDLSSQIPVVPYFSLDYTQGETVIIVGGETEGLSEKSFQLVSDTQGVRVNIPLNNGVESLNSGMALGIIAFEVKRQFLVEAQKAEKNLNLN